MASETGEMRRKGAIFDGAPAPERAVLLEIPAGLNVRAAVAVAMRALAAFWYAKMRVASREKKEKERDRDFGWSGSVRNWTEKSKLRSLVIVVDVYYRTVPDRVVEGFGKLDPTRPDRVFFFF